MRKQISKIGFKGTDVISTKQHYDVEGKQIMPLHHLFYQVKTKRDYPCYTFISAAYIEENWYNVIIVKNA